MATKVNTGSITRTRGFPLARTVLLLTLLALPILALMSTTIGSNPSPTKTLALVDDDKNIAESLTRNFQFSLPTVSVTWFPSCEKLIDEMKRGKTFTAYLVDKEFRNGMWGPACTALIKRWDPAANVVGYSSDWQAREEFLEAGARDFFFKGDEVSVLIGILRTLLAP